MLLCSRNVYIHPLFPEHYSHTTEGRQHPDLPLWSLRFELMLLSEPMRTAVAGTARDRRCRTKSRSALVNKLASLTPTPSYDQQQEQQTHRQQQKHVMPPCYQQKNKPTKTTTVKHCSHNTHQQVNKWHAASPCRRMGEGGEGHLFAMPGTMPSIQILWRMPPVANQGVMALLAAKLRLKWDGRPSHPIFAGKFKTSITLLREQKTITDAHVNPTPPPHTHTADPSSSFYGLFSTSVGN